MRGAMVIIIVAAVVVVLALRRVGGGVASSGNGASFKECYAKCFIFCVIEPPHSAIVCSLACLRDCIIPPNAPQATPTPMNIDTHRFCKLGCAASLCTTISTKQNPSGEKVGSCVGSCSEMCSSNYYYSSP